MYDGLPPFQRQAAVSKRVLTANKDF